MITLTRIMKGEEFSFIRLELGKGKMLFNAGTLSVTNIDYEMLTLLLLLGCRQAGLEMKVKDLSVGINADLHYRDNGNGEKDNDSQ